jgi:hypothetical protein
VRAAQATAAAGRRRTGDELALDGELPGAEEKEHDLQVALKPCDP